MSLTYNQQLQEKSKTVMKIPSPLAWILHYFSFRQKLR